MADVTINDVLNDFDKLDSVDKEHFLEVANKQLMELKRSQLADRVKEANQNYGKGNVQSGNAEDLIRDLEND
ncbi:MAG: hypothetical protein FIA82_04255 [Melioribacter sp.]|nr:hypothetical protein [Melioribacter sp.]